MTSGSSSMQSGKPPAKKAAAPSRTSTSKAAAPAKGGKGPAKQPVAVPHPEADGDQAAAAAAAAAAAEAEDDGPVQRREMRDLSVEEQERFCNAVDRLMACQVAPGKDGPAQPSTYFTLAGQAPHTHAHETAAQYTATHSLSSSPHTMVHALHTHAEVHRHTGTHSDRHHHRSRSGCVACHPSVCVAHRHGGPDHVGKDGISHRLHSTRGDRIKTPSVVEYFFEQPLHLAQIKDEGLF